MPHADINELRLHYEDHGAGEPILAIAGLAADHGGWMLQVPVLSAAHRLIVFDNRDIGSSSYVTSDYAISDLAADTLALADYLGLERFHLLGESMGGAIAQHVALAAPDRVATVTLSATWLASGVWERARGAVLEAEVQLLSRQQFDELLMAHTMSPAFYEDAERLAIGRQLLGANEHPQPPEAFARQLRATYTHDLRDRIGSLSMPVQVISGEMDMLLPPFRQRELHAGIRGSRLIVVPGAAHGIHLEFPELFNELVLSLIAEHPITAAAAV